MAPRYSLIIPVWNDTAELARTLGHLESVSGIDDAEVIVASPDDRQTLKRAVAGRARILHSLLSTRAGLMNQGAAAAAGAVLFFLHADSLPPVNALELINEAMSSLSVVGGAFEHRFRDAGWNLRTISWTNRMRYRLTRNYYGDQGLFVRAGAFREMGGYRELQLMEDLDFSRRLKRRGRTVLIHTPLFTSGRRFQSGGPWRTFLFIVWLLALYTLGLDTQRYAGKWRAAAGRFNERMNPLGDGKR